MRSGVIAQKVGMMRVFTDAGEHAAGDCAAIGQLSGYRPPHQGQERLRGAPARLGHRKVKGVNKAERGHFAAAKVEPKRKLAEFRVEENELIRSARKSPPIISSSASSGRHRTSIGKGFAGPMKRLEFRRSARHHGVVDLAPLHGSPAAARIQARPSRTRRWRPHGRGSRDHAQSQWS